MDKERITVKLNKLIIYSLILMMFSSTISIGGSSIGMGFAILFWLVKIIINRKINIAKNPFKRPMLVFLGSVLFSFIGSYNLEKSFDELEGFLFPFLIFFIIIDTVSDLKTADRLFNVGLISIIISSLYALIWQYYHLGMNRVSVEFMALDYGALLQIYALFALVFLLWNNGKPIKRFKYAGIFIITLLTLILNKSRGVWLGFTGASFLLFWIKNNRKWIIVFIVVIIIGTAFAPTSIQNRVNSIVDIQNNKSNIQRLWLWEAALLMFKEHPINGVGLGSYSQVYDASYRRPESTTNSHAHNNFLNFLAETGIVGFAGFIYLLYYVVKYLYLNYLNIKENKYKLFILASLGIFIGVFIIQGFTEVNFDKAVVGRSVWFILGLAVVIINNFIEYKKVIL